MKSIFNFIKTTVYGGVLFLIPITIIYYILKDIYNNLFGIVAPIAVSAGVESIFGKITVIIIVILILILICFIAGLIVKLGLGKRFNEKIDEIAVTFIPGYSKMKSEAIKKVDKKLLDKTENVYDDWETIIMKINMEWKVVFIVEESENGYLTIFEPGSPEFLKGVTKIFFKSDIKFFPVDKDKAIAHLKKFGSGSTEFITKALG